MSSGYDPAQISAALATATSRWQEMQREAALSPPSEGADAGFRLRFAGSHDLVMDMLAQRLQSASSPVVVDVTYNGSLGGLMALARGEADVAGTHLWDRETDRYNEPFVTRLLPGRAVVLMTLVHRRQGFITAPGNPRKLQQLTDLRNTEIRFLNRQPGSGTRVWLDAQFRAAGISPGVVTGYEHEATTHMELARAVAEGDADVGLGIHAAAAAFDLEFVPLMEERYDLVFTAESWESQGAKRLRQIIGSDSFQQAVRSLGGYDTRETGLARRL